MAQTLAAVPNRHKPSVRRKCAARVWIGAVEVYCFGGFFGRVVAAWGDRKSVV